MYVDLHRSEISEVMITIVSNNIGIFIIIGQSKTIRGSLAPHLTSAMEV